MPIWIWKRTLRTPSSERFLATDATAPDRDLAAVDLHYLPGGNIAGTVILLPSSGFADSDIPALLESLDDDLLPSADIDDGTITFTVIRGSVIGAFQPGSKPA